VDTRAIALDSVYGVRLGPILAPPMDLVIFSTCPQSRGIPREEYGHRVAEVARWSEVAGYEGILVYTSPGPARRPW
jgi:hypothetical protein